MDEGDILFERMPDYTGGKKAAPATAADVAAKRESARISPEDQKPKDVESRKILEDELIKNIKWFEENSRKPTPAGQKEGEEFKARLARTQGDIESLKRELGRMGPAPEALPAATPADAAEPSLGEGDVKLNEIPAYEDVTEAPNANASMGVSPELTAGASGAAGALYGAAKKPTYSQTFADLARDVYGVPSEAVESYLMKKYPQPATSAQLAKDTAQELVERAAARSASAQTAAANMGDLALDEHGTVRWTKPRVSPKIGVPSALTNKIVGLTGNASVPGSAENILAENAERVRKLQAMGHDVANMPKSGEFLLTENYRTRGGPRPATTAAPLPTTAPAAAAPAAPAAGGSYLDDLAKRIQKAGGLAEVLSRGAKAGLYGGAAAMSGLDLWHAINSMTQEGVNPQNALQGAEGAGFLASLRYPRMGLGVAGAAKTARAGETMYGTGVNPQNAAQAASGVGIAAMPYAPRVGAAMQIPELALAAKEWLLAHPEFGQQLQKGSQTWGQSRFGLD